MLTNCAISFALTVAVLCDSLVYYSPCDDDVGRVCSSGDNKTNLLMNYKRGGTDILSSSVYIYDFFLCQQYNYDCGYMLSPSSYVSISNGISLQMSVDQLTSITVNPDTQTLIQPYLNIHGNVARCGMVLFPLMLTSDQSKQVLDGYMQQLATNVSAQYEAQRDAPSTQAWADININIRTALLQKLKTNSTMVDNSTLWTQFVANNFTTVSAQLKTYYTKYDQQIDLHAAYLIDSVTHVCNKDQSINFLVDESGSIGPTGFQTALQFLTNYVNTTNDDLSKVSINFFDSTFDSYIGYGNNLSQLLYLIPKKSYRGYGTMTGDAMNHTIDIIEAANFSSGLPKVMVLMTDGGAMDSITQAISRARAAGITIIAVGIGILVDDSQLLQIAGQPSNYIKISGYSDLPKLVRYIQNFFCKQIYTIQVNQSYINNFVREPSSPSYFRVVKSPLAEGQWCQFQISYEQDPVAHGHVQYQSLVDPFPDSFTQYTSSQHYNVFAPATSANKDGKLASTFVPKVIYFIAPQQTIEYSTKKTIISQMNASVSYISIGGNNLGFNVSLTACTTLTCVYEKAKYGPYSPSYNPTVVIVPPDEDLSIFIAIGGTLAALACLCMVLIFAVRRCGQEEEKKKRSSTLPQLMEETLISRDSKEKKDIVKQTNTNITPHDHQINQQIIQVEQL